MFETIIRCVLPLTWQNEKGKRKPAKTKTCNWLCSSDPWLGKLVSGGRVLRGLVSWVFSRCEVP